MSMSSLVVSRDWQEVSVLECILGSLHIDVDVESNPEVAYTRLSNSKVDALIIDWDLHGTDRLLRNLERKHKSPAHGPLVVMSRASARRQLEATGALFSFEKPISVEEAVRTLSAARNLILDGRLRYHRQHVEIPVALTWKTKRRVNAELINLSQGGIGVHMEEPVRSNQAIGVSFRLPGTRTTVKARGEIAWMDERGRAGIRFTDIAPRQQRGLELWLAQQYFAN
jgi:hypothetical protein